MTNKQPVMTLGKAKDLMEIIDLTRGYEDRDQDVVTAGDKTIGTLRCYVSTFDDNPNCNERYVIEQADQAIQFIEGQIKQFPSHNTIIMDTFLNIVRAVKFSMSIS